MPLMGVKANAATFSYDPAVYSSKGVVQNSLSMIFNKYPNGSTFTSSGYKGGYQCYGFAKYCVDTIGHWDGTYGKKRTVLNRSLTPTNIRNLSKWPIGTHLRIGNINATINGGENNGHSIVLLKVTNTNIYYAEANWAKPNKVTYTASSISAFDQKYSGYKKIQYVDAPRYFRSSGRVNYYTIKYNANGGNGIMYNTKVVYGKATKTTNNKFTRSGYSFNGWAVRRYVNNRTGWLWYCQKGDIKKWCKTLPSGYSYVKYSNGCTVSTTAAAGSTVQFYALWKKTSGGTSVINPTSVSLNAASKTMSIGGTYRLSATIAPSNTTNKTITWSTSNSNVATVNSSGGVTAVAAGSATITAKTHNGKTATCTVTVKKNTQPVASTLQLASYTSGPGASIVRGTSVYIKGSVKSNYKISNITISILNSSGQTIQKGSYNPSAYTADLSKADVGYIYFSKLPTGKYTMKITATDQQQTKVLKNVTFNIYNTVLYNYSGVPSSIKKGTSVYIKGTFKSYHKITAVSISIYNSKNTRIQYGRYLPNAYTADLSKADVGSIYFSKLAKGNYKMVVKATTTAGTFTFDTKNFTVK